ncbi:Gamma-crystallin M1 [Merluccius polli]|uniref:Gamma-crystallin M1 n=1 Tax=Merluccius polli TaxID=89951 RepID=A0AA47P4H7_MERPO|nr:Gamma-crystallin M1 [Merluccius polli]
MAASFPGGGGVTGGSWPQLLALVRALNKMAALHRARPPHCNQHGEDCVLYKERDFLGPSVECPSEGRDLLCLLSCCNSNRVESGAFMIY